MIASGVAAMADLHVLKLICLLTLIAVIRSILSRLRSRRPPGPIALPVIGHLHLMRPIPHQALYNLSLKYGPLMHIFLGSVPYVVVSSPDMARQFLKTHDVCFSNRFKTVAIDSLFYGLQNFGFSPYGPYWRFMRKLCTSELLSGRTLDQFLPVRREEITRFLQVITEKGNRGGSEEAVDIGVELLVLTNNIICRMMMSQVCSGSESEVEQARRLVRGVTTLAGKFNLSDYIWLFKNMDVQGFRESTKLVHEEFDSMMERIIKEHEEADKDDNSCRDVLDILLHIAKDEKSEMTLSNDNIKAFVLEMFAAGTDSSALTITWAMAELINHPEIMQKAQEEIDSVVGKRKVVEESDISNLPYLQAIVKETLRLHPTGPMIVRESSESCTISGYEIPAKTRVFVNVWAIGRDPSTWDNTLEFQPQRFMSNDQGMMKGQLDLRAGQHFEMLPFGSGRRMCPGASLAMLVVETTLAAMLQRFDWKTDGPVNMDEAPGLALPRAHPLLCVPVPRCSTIQS